MGPAPTFDALSRLDVETRVVRHSTSVLVGDGHWPARPVCVLARSRAGQGSRPYIRRICGVRCRTTSRAGMEPRPYIRCIISVGRGDPRCATFYVCPCEGTDTGRPAPSACWHGRGRARGPAPTFDVYTVCVVGQHRGWGWNSPLHSMHYLGWTWRPALCDILRLSL